MAEYGYDKNFKELLLANPAIMDLLSQKEIEGCFAFNSLYANAKTILSRVLK